MHILFFCNSGTWPVLSFPYIGDGPCRLKEASLKGKCAQLVIHLATGKEEAPVKQSLN